MLLPHADDIPDLPGLDDDDVEPEEDEVGDDDPDARGLTRVRHVYPFPAVSRATRLVGWRSAEWREDRGIAGNEKDTNDCTRPHHPSVLVFATYATISEW